MATQFGPAGLMKRVGVIIVSAALLLAASVVSAPPSGADGISVKQCQAEFPDLSIDQCTWLEACAAIVPVSTCLACLDAGGGSLPTQCGGESIFVFHIVVDPPEEPGEAEASDAVPPLRRG